MGTRIVLGITGGIAAYKTPHLIRLLRKTGAAVKVVVTRHALPFVGVEALRTVSGFPVYHDESTDYDIGHIRLTQWADLMLIAPATANTIAKIAHGIADNLLSSTLLAFPPEKTIIVPAMNTGMWRNAATQENIAILSSRGAVILPVGTGELACGDEGEGRMISPEEITSAVETMIARGKLLTGKKVLISSGPTEESIDPVRVITNRSSGKMGAALAEEALALGAEVTVVSGPASAPLPAGANIIPVRTTAEMESALQRHFSDADICIMAAAVGDYHPSNPSDEKIHRSGSEPLTLTLIPNSDILAGLGKCKHPRQILVGFALDSRNDEARAIEKMRKKHCDFMVCNVAATSLGTEDTKVTLLRRDGARRESGTVSKRDAARALFSFINESTETNRE